MKNEKNIFDIIFQKSAETQTKIDIELVDNICTNVSVVSYCDQAVLVELNNGKCLAVNRQYIISISESDA